MWLLLLCDDELKLNKQLVLRNSRRNGGGLGKEGDWGGAPICAVPSCPAQALQQGDNSCHCSLTIVDHR